jgi:hypothetical protein
MSLVPSTDPAAMERSGMVRMYADEAYAYANKLIKDWQPKYNHIKITLNFFYSKLIIFHSYFNLFFMIPDACITIISQFMKNSYVSESP